eukprot:1158075-Pelagomonas_calceolata.AAC.3
MTTRFSLRLMVNRKQRKKEWPIPYIHIYVGVTDVTQRYVDLQAQIESPCPSKSKLKNTPPACFIPEGARLCSTRVPKLQITYGGAYAKLCQISRGVNPSFDHHPCIPDHPLHQIGEKTKWLVKYRVSAIYLGENPAQGDVSIVQEGYIDMFLGVKIGPRVELRAVLGDLRPGECVHGGVYGGGARGQSELLPFLAHPNAA